VTVRLLLVSADPNQPVAKVEKEGLAEMVAALDALDAQLHHTRLVLGAHLKAAEIAADPARMAQLAEEVERVQLEPPKPDPPGALERRLAELRRQR
jgi:glutathione S-transferase